MLRLDGLAARGCALGHNIRRQATPILQGDVTAFVTYVSTQDRRDARMSAWLGY